MWMTTMTNDKYDRRGDLVDNILQLNKDDIDCT